MSSCLDCGRPTQTARCRECRAEHGAPQYQSGDCPTCGQQTTPAGVDCSDCLGGGA